MLYCKKIIFPTKEEVKNHNKYLKSKFIYSFEWEPNCLALWSNYAVLHSPVNDFTGVDRVMHRITIQ